MPHSFLLGSHADECKVPALYQHCVERLMSGCVHQVFLHLHQMYHTNEKETSQVIRIAVSWVAIRRQRPWNAFNPKNSPQKPPFVTWNSYISRGRVKYYGIFSRQTANHGDPASNDLVTMMWHELWSREPWKKNMINIIYATATVILQFLDLSSFSSKESSITLDSCSLVWNRIMWQVLPPKSSQGFGTSPNPGREVNQPMAVHRHLDPTEEPPHRLNGEFSVHLSWGFHCATDGLIEDVTNQVPAAITRTCSTKLVFFVKSTKYKGGKKAGFTMFFFNQMILPESTRDYLW